jgi:pimeloyl-ACP methyl ester carboxylesterase
MYLRTDDLPEVPDERWWGDHLRETRWTLELSRLLADPVFHGRGVPRGDGRPVVLMPGFGGGDYTLLALAVWLRRIGYEPHVAGFVTNTGCSDRGLDRVERRAQMLYETHGRRVALIGHSRSGHYVRALSHRRPDLVSHGISIGAGLRAMLATSYPTVAAVGAARRVVIRSRRARSPLCLTEGCDCRFGADFAGSFPTDRVRLTSIYSKGDGVVRWQAAVVPYATCVEVTGSHVGLIFNRKTYRAIATALAESELPLETELEDPDGDRAR